VPPLSFVDGVAAGVGGLICLVAIMFLVLLAMERILGWHRSPSVAEIERAEKTLSDALVQEHEGESCEFLVRGFKEDGDNVVLDEPVHGCDVLGYEIDPEFRLAVFHVHRRKA